MTDQSPPKNDADTIADGRQSWLDNPKNIDKVFWSVVLLSVLLFFGDALYHKHPEFSIEKAFGFYGVFGFCACVGLVLTAKILRGFLIRDENYYDDKTTGDS